MVSSNQNTCSTKPWQNCNDAQTLQSFGTNGTLHRRTNSPSLLTQSSLSLIFNDSNSPSNDAKQGNNSHCPYRTIPRSFIPQGMHEVTCSEERPEEVSPIDDSRSVTMIYKVGLEKDKLHAKHDVPYPPTSRSDLDGPFDLELNGIHRKLSVNLFGRQGKQLISEPALNIHHSNTSEQDNKVKLDNTGEQVTAINEHLKCENRTYLPVCDLFKLSMNSSRLCTHQSISFEGWLAFSKGRRIIDVLESGSGLSRTDLRYVIIRGSSVHVFTSKKNKKEESRANNDAVKVLVLTADMNVRIKLLSKEHGHCVTIEDGKRHKVTCTLLPVGFDPGMFRDQDYSQVVGQKFFDDTKEGLFAKTAIVSESGVSTEQICNTVAKDVGKKWPEYINDIAPFEQHMASLQTMFALDCAIRGTCTTPSYRQQ